VGGSPPRTECTAGTLQGVSSARKEFGLGENYKTVPLTIPAGYVIFPSGPAKLCTLKELPCILLDVFLLLKIETHPIQYLPSMVPLACSLNSHCHPRELVGASTKVSALPQEADEASFHVAAGFVKVCV